MRRKIEGADKGFTRDFIASGDGLLRAAAICDLKKTRMVARRGLPLLNGGEIYHACGTVRGHGRVSLPGGGFGRYF